MQFFNTRVCGVIVGGAAVQSNVLKSITAKHLALAGQSLGFMISMIPFIKSTVESALPPKQQILAADFDRVLQVCLLVERRSIMFFRISKTIRNKCIVASS